MTNPEHNGSSAGSVDGPDTPDEALDLLMHEAGWIDMHGGDHHEDDCSICRSIAMVRAGLNHAYPPSHAGGTFTDAQPDLLASTVSCSGLEITIQCNDHGVKDRLMDFLTGDIENLLEQIAAKFEAWDTFDLFRSEAAATVRSFKPR
jgi:hypothetical protein